MGRKTIICFCNDSCVRVVLSYIGYSNEIYWFVNMSPIMFVQFPTWVSSIGTLLTTTLLQLCLRLDVTKRAEGVRGIAIGEGVSSDPFLDYHKYTYFYREPSTRWQSRLQSTRLIWEEGFVMRVPFAWLPVKCAPCLPGIRHALSVMSPD
jgi:hypothetical protein